LAVEIFQQINFEKPYLKLFFHYQSPAVIAMDAEKPGQAFGATFKNIDFTIVSNIFLVSLE